MRISTNIIVAARVALAAACFAGSVCAREVRITLLSTTDLHGFVMPWDYFTGQPAERGLAKVATLIRAERKANPNTLLVDTGDTIQGSTLEGVYQHWVRTGKAPPGTPSPSVKGDPMMLAMNELGYDAMAVGNHEFNFGLANLEKARSTAKFPWISANIHVSPGSPVRRFAPFVIREISGVKIAVVGLTTPAVPAWEKPENLRTLKFLPGTEAVAAAVAELRRKHRPDLIIVAAHAGVERDFETGAIRSGENNRENMVYSIAERVDGIDAVVFGHTHRELPEYRIADVLLMQPRNWGMSLGKMDFVLESKPGGGWRIISKKSTTIPVNRHVSPDPAVLRIAQPYHEMAERYLDTPVAKSARALSASYSRVQDTAIIDAIHRVQIHYAKADVSLSASFNTRASVPSGPVTIRQIAALYVYDNELYAVEVSGKTLKDALENSARYYRTCPDTACSHGPLINPRTMGFNYDTAQGVEYDIDLTKPVGQRIVNLRFRGAPLAAGRKLRLALNSYRAGGSGGYRMLRGAPVLWRSYEDMRELIIRYYSERPIPQQPDNNWRIIPSPAAKLLAEEARAGSSRPLDK